MKPIKRKLNWVPDLPDWRDHVFAPKPELELPKVVDLRQYASPVEDQGDLGSCTGNAFAGAIELIDRRRRHVDVSRLFIYYNERALIGETHLDEGAYIRDGIKTLAKEGWATEKEWPYIVEKWDDKPPAWVYRNALKRTIDEYQRITGGLVHMKGALAEGLPFVFGFAVFDGFMTDKVAETGVMTMPTRKESMQGGHAVLAVGYDDSPGVIICRNSWGEEWGQGGYFTMPYEFASSTDYCDDLWVIRLL